MTYSLYFIEKIYSVEVFLEKNSKVWIGLLYILYVGTIDMYQNRSQVVSTI